MDIKKYTYFDLNSAEKDLNQSLILPSINESTKIRDSRLLKDFKLQTFGGYQKSQVSSALEKAIQDEKVDEAIQWSFQLFFRNYEILYYGKFYILVVNTYVFIILNYRVSYIIGI